MCIRDRSGKDRWCSGTIIHKMFVLTAARCCKRKGDDWKQVKMWFNDRSTVYRERGEIIRTSSQWTIHNLYDLSKGKNNDLCIIQLNEDLSNLIPKEKN